MRRRAEGHNETKQKGRLSQRAIGRHALALCGAPDWPLL